MFLPRRPAARRRLALQRLEARDVPASFTIANGDIAALIAAINTANTNNQADTINLAPNGMYSFNAVDNTDGGAGPNALPVIGLDTNSPTNSLTFQGNGATFTRNPATAPDFRFFRVTGALAGGAMLNLNDLTLSNGRVTGTGVGGGAIQFAGGNGAFTNVSFIGNSAGGSGGAIYGQSSSSRTLSLTNSTFTNNTALGSNGGAIFNLGTQSISINGSIFSGNTAAGSGGGVFNQGSPLTVAGSNFLNNISQSSTGSGGAISTLDALTFTNGTVRGNRAGSGAGLDVFGDATVTGSAIAENISSFNVGTGGGLNIAGNLQLTNATVAGNTGAGSGGGVYAGGKSISINNSTIVNNQAQFNLGSGGGVYIGGGTGTTASINNSIIAGNSFAPGVTGGTGPDLAGALTNLAYSLVGVNAGYTSSAGSKNQTGTLASPLSPMLAPLGNYGGTTLTMPPLTGSPAIDTGDPAFNATGLFDQRGTGFDRSVGGKLDLGAFEAAQATLGITLTRGPNSTVPGRSANYTLTVTNTGTSAVSGINLGGSFGVGSGPVPGISYTASYGTGGSGPTSGSDTAGALNGLLNLPAGGSATFNLTAALASSATGTLTGRANITTPLGTVASSTVGLSGLDTVALTPQADLSVTISDGRSIAFPSTGTTYTLVIQNTGPSDAPGTKLTLPVPTGVASFQYTSVTSAGVTGNSSGTGALTQTLNLPAGGSATYTVVTSVSNTAAGTLMAIATVTPATGVTDLTSGNNTGSDQNTIVLGSQVTVVAPDAGFSSEVKVYNSVSGALAKSFYAFDSGFRGGVRVAVADFNDDGTQDFVVAAGPGGGPHVKLIDGITGQVKLSFYAFDPNFHGGVSVATGDLNGDGKPDIIAAAGATGGPHVRVFDGVTGQQISGSLGSFYAYNPAFTGGVNVSAGDIDGDGIADIITGAGAGGGPHVEAFSGRTGAIVRSFMAYDSRFTGGVYVAAGDFTGDGLADIATGPGIGGGAHLKLFDGLNGLQIASRLPLSSSLTGTVYTGDAVWSSGLRVAVTDVNSDGYADIIIAPGSGRTGRVDVLDGIKIATGNGSSILRETESFDPSFLGGIFVGGA